MEDEHTGSKSKKVNGLSCTCSVQQNGHKVPCF